ncbi:uncharacterized protein PHACADRAFT_214562 [Phanerochaete carnosa HHB-10118-sp]|uniref:Uncharacterized protein n=1 Tax=Phanerochaete carnosa (strain HHB-10118-sp) TaxID=650164 RepID=K5VQF6_PHACS|nr:uncharacterized protein PHACADRAFT_214562 [Phanerochaete carnosa HHB-10118-sp]EKM48970.1 hypothetical protein PHACADRAFT_214562 [Phanerochaete carnosa HHB-10118-sp]
MWCTRWYLPLVLLPLPIAPPYFLVLFLLSTTLHARPCFYCIMLLSAMFMASCYWPPISLDTPLSKPWSDSITTFGEALLSRVPDLPADLIPAAMPIADRCWCELSMGFFEPFNSTRWEWSSVEKLKTELEQRWTDRGMNNSQSATETLDLEDNSAVKSNATSGFSVLSSTAGTFSAVQRKLGLSNGLDIAANSTATSTVDVPPDTPPPMTYSLRAAENEANAEPGSFFKQYDLRPYGFDMIVDFSWPRSP